MIIILVVEKDSFVSVVTSLKPDPEQTHLLRMSQNHAKMDQVIEIDLKINESLYLFGS